MMDFDSREASDFYELDEKKAKKAAPVITVPLADDPNTVDLNLGTADAEFANHDDLLGHTEAVVLRQSQFVKLHRIKAGSGPRCRMNDWVTINYKGYDMDGKKLEDNDYV